MATKRSSSLSAPTWDYSMSPPTTLDTIPSRPSNRRGLRAPPRQRRNTIPIDSPQTAARTNPVHYAHKRPTLCMPRLGSAVGVPDKGRRRGGGELEE
jgi:hypothetical protein